MEPAAKEPKADLAKRPLKCSPRRSVRTCRGTQVSPRSTASPMIRRTAPLLKEMRGSRWQAARVRKGLDHIGRLPRRCLDLTEAKGKLTAGFGAPENKIGPEFTFGLTMEKLLNEPVLIIKTAWGGRSLHTDFRPPSAGAFVMAKKQRSLGQASARCPWHS